MAELVTLQFGGAANWVGAHLWNINSDPAARSSVIFTARQHSCPRLVSFDLASSVGATSRGRDVDPAADNAGVPENVVRIERQAHEVDTSNPSLWTDFITTPLMRDSVVRLGNLDWNDSNPNEFNNFTFGRRLMAGQNDREAMTEPLRKQVEDCDELQGFPVLLDHTQPAFAGFLSEYLVHLQDEYPRTPVLLFSVGVEAELPPVAVQQRERRILNECLAIQSLHSTDLFVPLPLAPSAAPFRGLPHYQPTNRLHASGLLALGIDTALSPLWLANSPRPLSSVLVQLSTVGPARRLAALSLALPHTADASHKPSLLCPMLPASGLYAADSALCVARGVTSVPPSTALRLSLSLPPLPKSDIIERLLCPRSAEGASTFAVPPALAQIEKTNGFHARLAELGAEFARIDRHRAVQCLGDEITVDDVREAQAALTSIVELYASD